MRFSNNPKGIFLGPNHNIKAIDKNQIKNIQFIVGDAGDGWNISPNFTDIIQLAYDLSLPMIAYYHVSMEQYQALVAGFPEPKDDWNVKNLARMLLMNLKFISEGATLVVDENGLVPGNHRKVASIILDLTANKDRTTGNMTTAGWLRKISENISSVMYKAFELPQWYYVTQSLIDMYPSGNQDIAQWLANLDGVVSWKTAYPTNTATVHGSFENFPIPPDDYAVPAFYDKTYFFKYANTKFIMPSISGGTTPLFMYNGTLEQFYKDINYTPSETVPVNPPVDPPVSGSVDLTDVNAKVSTLQNDLNALKTSIANIK